VAGYGSSSKNIGKMSLQPILNKNSPHAHIKLEFDKLGIARKLVKYASHSFKRKKSKKINLSFHKVTVKDMQ
jgi:hypothetical protein